MASSSSTRSQYERKVLEKVCAIFKVMGQWSIYIIDLELDKPPPSDPHAHEFVDLDHPCDHGFVDKLPNLLLYGSECPCFCGLGKKVFMFEGIDKARFKLDDEGIFALRLDSKMDIYAFVPSNLLKMHDCSMEKSEMLEKGLLQKIGQMQGPKIAPEAIRYGSSILVFSTNIPYVSSTEDILPADFELYIPALDSTIRLPSLRVSRRRLFGSGCRFYLLHSTSKREHLTPTFQNVQCPCMSGGYGSRSCCGSSFTIFNFSLVAEHIFVVTTRISGLSFYLNLEFPGDWQIYKGPSFPDAHCNFVTKNGLILAPTRAPIYYNDSYGPIVELPLSSYVSDSDLRNRLMELVEGTKFAIVVQVGFDYALRPHWTLDMLRLDESKFLACLVKEKENKEKGDNESAEVMKSYKFLCKGSSSYYIPMCLHPF